MSAGSHRSCTADPVTHTQSLPNATKPRNVTLQTIREVCECVCMCVCSCACMSQAFTCVSDMGKRWGRRIKTLVCESQRAFSLFYNQNLISLHLFEEQQCWAAATLPRSLQMNGRSCTEIYWLLVYWQAAGTKRPCEAETKEIIMGARRLRMPTSTSTCVWLLRYMLALASKMVLSVNQVIVNVLVPH